MTSAAQTVEPATGLPPAETTNRDLWRWRADLTPDREWLRFEGRSWTFAAADLEMRRVAAGLRALGVGKGERVLLGLKNRPETVFVQLALSEIGAVSVPLVSGVTLDELKYPIAHSEARLVIADDAVATEILANRSDFPAIERVVVLDGLEADWPDVIPYDDIVADDPLEHAALDGYDGQTLAMIVYTSGSTGRPKGVMLKAGTLRACGIGYADLYQITSEDNYICATTLAHSLGAIAAVGITVVLGARLTLVERFRPSRFWQQVDDNGATVSVLFATHLNLLLEVDDGSRPAGAGTFRLAITHIHHPRFAERFGVRLATIWGMSETCICAGSDPGYQGDLGQGYFGRPFGGGEIGIFDPETFEPLPPGQRGELALRHPQVMLGYFRDPEATERTLVDGWVRSGDMAYMDHSGRGFFVGRYKAMIKRSGENVSAEEVEAAIVAHQAVAEACVLGVPDPLRSEEVAAVVVPRAGAELGPGELRASCGERLVRWKLPRYIAVQDEPLPRLPNGKVDRVAITAAYDTEQAWDAEASG